MIIYLIRHGLTNDNIEGVFQGPDSELSPEGEIQAGKLAERLGDWEINEIWSSPMIRAYKTAEFINKYQKTNIVTVPELSEIARPTSVWGKKPDDPQVKALGYTGVWALSDPYIAYEDGESLADLVARAKQVLNLLEEKSHQHPIDFSLAITSHGLMLAVLLMCILLGEAATPELVLATIKRLKLENTGISIAKLDSGKWRLLTMGDYAHL